MSKLIVGSVFANDSPEQQQWLDLQLRFLRATTSDFDHVVVLMSKETSSYFRDHTNVLIPDDLTQTASSAHVIGLRTLKEHFEKSDANYFLFIDGDAFPIKINWINVLLRSMEPEEKQFENMAVPNLAVGKDYDIAVALRSENLETRLHASVLFAKKRALPHLNFVYGPVGNDLQGNLETDVNLNVYQREKRDLALPLIRTNQYNVHPLACGIYFDMFYHHCCGSGRTFNLRAQRYFSRIVPSIDDSAHLTNQLMTAPRQFIRRLAGWNPMRYAEV